MARIDDYINAKKLVAAQLAKQELNSIRQRSGYDEIEGNNSLKIPFLNRVYKVSFPKFDFIDLKDSSKEVPLQEQVLILHYLAADTYLKPNGRWVAYREISGAAFYFGAFVKRAIDPLKKVFGTNSKGLKKAAELLCGKPVDNGDSAFEFQVLPNVPLQLIIWEGDEDFGPEANILFDESVAKRLSPEDCAWLAGMLVYRLIALSFAG